MVVSAIGCECAVPRIPFSADTTASQLTESRPVAPNERQFIDIVRFDSLAELSVFGLDQGRRCGDGDLRARLSGDEHRVDRQLALHVHDDAGDPVFI